MRSLCASFGGDDGSFWLAAKEPSHRHKDYQCQSRPDRAGGAVVMSVVVRMSGRIKRGTRYVERAIEQIRIRACQYGNHHCVFARGCQCLEHGSVVDGVVPQVGMKLCGRLESA